MYIVTSIADSLPLVCQHRSSYGDAATGSAGLGGRCGRVRSRQVRMMSRDVGLRWIPVFVRTSTTRILESGPGCVPTTSPRGHSPLGKVPSDIRTMSPTLGSRWCCEFAVCLGSNSGRYSFVHLCQNWSASCWAALHVCVSASRVLKLPMGVTPHDRPIRKWFGVNASLSRSGCTGVSGRAFTTCSTSSSSVWSVSSLGARSFNTADSDVLTVLIMRSHAPPICGAPGGMNFHKMPRDVA